MWAASCIDSSKCPFLQSVYSCIQIVLHIQISTIYFFNLHSFSSNTNYHSLLSSLNACLICNLQVKACTYVFWKVIEISHIKFLLLFFFFSFLFRVSISSHFSSWFRWLHSMCPYSVEYICVCEYINMYVYIWKENLLNRSCRWWN